MLLLALALAFALALALALALVYVFALVRLFVRPVVEDATALCCLRGSFGKAALLLLCGGLKILAPPLVLPPAPPRSRRARCISLSRLLRTAAAVAPPTALGLLMMSLHFGICRSALVGANVR